MGSYIGRAAGFGAVVVTAAALTAAPSAALALPTAHKQINVPCSSPALINAVNTANALGVPTTIRIAAHCIYSVVTPGAATSALPIITGNITIVGGPSSTIRRDAAAATSFRILDVAVGGTLSVRGIFILSGTSTTGGGIQNAGSLTLDRVTLSGNTATTIGGAVANLAGATAVINRTVINGNAATTNGGGVHNAGTLTVFESRLSGNNATVNGGGIHTETTGTTHLNQSTLDHNNAGTSGGGASNLGTKTIDHTLIELNHAGTSGGGVFNGGSATLTTSIVRNNTPNNCFPLNTIPGCVN